MRISHAIWLCLFVFAITGCEKKDSDARDEKVAKKSAPQEEQATEIQVKLLEAGSEPRQALRYKFKAGRKDKLVMDMKMTMAMSGAFNQPEMVLPVARTTMEINSVSVSNEGDLRYEFKVTDATVPDKESANPMMVQTMETELKKTVGMSGWAVVTPRGFTKDAEISVPAGASQQLKQLVDNLRQQVKQLSSPLPEEPVGVGAKWNVIMPLNTDALKLTQTAEYKLTNFEGNKGKLKIQVAQHAKKQKMNLPNLPPGSSATLKSLKTEASGNAEFDLTQPVPKSDMKLATKMDMQVNAQGQSQNIITDMKIDIKIHP